MSQHHHQHQHSTASVCAVYTQAAATHTESNNNANTKHSCSSSALFTHTHPLPVLPDHFTFPDVNDYYSHITVLLGEWTRHGYQLNNEHLADIVLEIEIDNQSKQVMEHILAQGYTVIDRESCTPRVRLVAHRVVLSTGSAVIKHIIHNASVCGAPCGYSASALVFSGVMPYPLLLVLHFLYSRTAVNSLREDNIIPVMQLARQLQVFPLLNYCQQVAKQLIQCANLAFLWQEAGRYKEGLILNVCTDFIVESITDVLTYEEFGSYPSFLRECIGSLVHNSDRIAKDQEYRQRLISLFEHRQQEAAARKVTKQQVERPASTLSRSKSSPASSAPGATRVLGDDLLAQMLEDNVKQLAVDPVSSLLSFFSGSTTSTTSTITRRASLPLPRSSSDSSAGLDLLSDPHSSSGWVKEVSKGMQQQQKNAAATRNGKTKSLGDEESSDSDSDSDSDSGSDSEQSPTSSALAAWHNDFQKHRDLSPSSSSCGSSSPSSSPVTSPQSSTHNKDRLPSPSVHHVASKLGFGDFNPLLASPKPPLHPVQRLTRDRSHPVGKQDSQLSPSPQAYRRGRRPSAPCL